MRTVKLFISSPGDLIPERKLCKQICAELQKHFADQLKLDIFFWEDEPVLASDTFQTQFPRAADSDIFICLLWSRIGTPLPKGAVFADGTPIIRADGSEYESGTVAEFEDALNAYQRHKSPAILMYFKRAEIQFKAEDPNFLNQSQQRHAVEQFFNKWFQDQQGRYPRGHSEFKTLTDFSQQLQKHLCKLILKRFIDPAQQQQRLCYSDWQGNPFLGLDSYQSQHSRIYFGRDVAINDIYNALQQQAQNAQPFVMVLGQSGSGKSSLIQAGVLPLFAQLNIPSYTFRPAFVQSSNNKSLWHGLRTQLPSKLQANHSPDLPAAILYIDQFEELFTLEQFNHDSRHYFFVALEKLLQHGKIWLLASMRSEFLAQTSDYPRLSRLLEGRGHYLLLPPSPSEIYRMIIEPAKSAGLIFETSHYKKPLNQLIFDAVVSQPYSLALLSFSLSELYQQRQDECLSYAAYEKMGSVQGALSRYAEKIYTELDPSQQQNLRIFIRALVKVNPDTNQGYSARAILQQQLSQNSAQQQLLEHLINARLFSNTQTPQGQQIIRVSHEALLNHWTRLKAWLTDDREYLLIRDRISTAAERWQQSEQHTELLLPAGKPLIEAQSLLTHWREALSHKEIDYIEQSEQRQNQKDLAKQQAATQKLKRSRQIIALFAFFNILLFISVYIAYQQRQEAKQAQHIAESEQQRAKHSALLAQQQKQQAEQQQQIAEQARRKTQRTQALFLADLARQQNQKGDYTLASLLALEGLPHNNKNSPFKRILVPQLAQQLYQAHSLQRTKAQIVLNASPLQMTYHPQNKEIAVGDLKGRIWRWDQNQQQLKTKPLILNDWGITKLAYSPDGRYLAASSEDGLIKLWQLKDGALQSQLRLKQQINYFEFSTDGQEIAIASGDIDNNQPQPIYLWDWQHKTQQQLKGHQSAVLHLNYHPDGKHLISAGSDQRAILWSLNLHTQEQSLYGHQAPLSQALFSPNKNRILTTDSAGVWCLWDAHGRLLNQESAHTAHISSSQFSPDGSQFATASWDGQAYIWDSETGQRLHALRGHQDEIYHLSYSPNSQQILTSSNDHSIRLWDSQTGDLISPLQAHPSRVYQAHFSPDGQQIASIGGQLWQTTGHQLNLWYNWAEQQHFAKQQSYFSLLDNEQIILHQDKQGTAQIWQAAQRQQLTSLKTGLHNVIQIQSNKQQIIFIGYNKDQQAEWQRWYQYKNSYRLHSHKKLDNFSSLSISPDKRTLVTGHHNGRLQLWRMRNAKRKNTFKFQQAAIQHIAFAADNQRLITADKQGNIYYYNTDPQGRYHVQSHWKIEVPIKQIAIKGDWILALNQTALYRQSLSQNDKKQRLSAPVKHNWHSFSWSPNKQKFALLSQGKLTRLYYWDWSKQNLFSNAQILNWNSSQHWHWLDASHLLNIDKEQSLNIWEEHTDGYHLQTWQQIPLISTTIQQIAYSNDILFALDNTGMIHRYPIYKSLGELLENSHQGLLRQLTQAEKQRFFLDDTATQP